VFLLVSLISAPLVNGQVISEFSFDISIGIEATIAPDSQPDNAVVSDFSRGSGINSVFGSGTFPGNSWTLASTLDPNDYFSVTLSPNSGFSLDLTSIVFDERRSGTGIREWSLFSSADNFATGITSVSVPDNTDTRTQNTVNLGSSFTGLTDTTEFRWYGFSAESGVGTWRLDNVVLNGSITAVPEPSTYALATAVVLIGFGIVRRKCRHR